jgi:hypothetical protein
MNGFEIAAIILAIGIGIAMAIVAIGWASKENH